MSFNDQEVNLTIQGKDLFSAEAKKSEQALQELGRESERLNEQLDDLKQQQEAIRAIDELTDSISRNEQAFSDNSVALDQLKREQKQAATEVKTLETAQREAAASTAKVETEYQQTAAQLAQYDSQVAATRAEVERLSATQGKGAQATAAQAQALSKAKADLQQLETTQRSTAASAEKLSQELEQERRGLNQLNTAVDEASRKKADYALKVKTASSELTQLGTSVNRNKQELGKQQAVLQKAGVDMERLGDASKELKLKQAAAEQALKGVNEKLTVHNALLQNNKTVAVAANTQTALTTKAVQTLAKAYAALLTAQQAVTAVKSGVENYGELEAAITKVEKTTGNARETVVKMAAELKELGEKVTPTSTNELLRMAEVAGQLGTKSTEDILNLVAAADALGLSTNLAGDEAATMLARILGMTNEGIPQIQNLSSSVVALGNDFAVTEADIVQMTKELVSGTREINLGSAAAAAFGATLAELGQPAERSRTAIQRLGAEINSASKKGGDSLETLMKITGLTAKQIEQDLGDAPEKVLVKFLEGLQKVKAEGGLVSDALKSMGIDGTEATGVLSVLADGTDRLKVALELSNKAYAAGDYHMKEAIKAYATQESALGRLSNKFHTLTTDIGQAFSYDTDLAIRGAGDAIDKVREDVVNLVERLPELVSGFVELAKAANDFVETFSDDKVGLFEKAFDRIKLGVNSLALPLSFITLSAQQAALDFTKLKNKAAEFFGLKVDTTFIDKLQIKMRELEQNLENNYKDMANAAARMAGESSIAYEKLLDASDKYKGAINKLSTEQQASLKNIIDGNKYNADSEKIYRDLTSAIVLANRELELEAEFKNKAAEASKKKAEADKQGADAASALAASQSEINISTGQYSITVKEAMARQAELNQLHEKGILSTETLNNMTALLYASVNNYSIAVDNSNTKTLTQTELTSAFISKRKELQTQYEKGLLTEKELNISLQELAASHTKAVDQSNKSIAATGLLSDAQLDLQEKILRTEKEVRDLEAALKDENKATAELTLIKAKLAKEEANLADLKRESVELSKIENATYVELLILQRDYEAQLEALDRNFRAGLLTKQEYDAQSQILKGTLSEVNKVVGESSKKTDENTEATKENTKATKDNTAAGIENAKVIAEQLSTIDDFRGSAAATRDVIVSLNTEYDYSNATIQAMTERLAQLDNQIAGADQKRERREINNAIRMRDWVTQIESGSLSLQELGELADLANNSVVRLSDNQLVPLNKAIDEARSRFRELADEINKTTMDIQDRLDTALGNQKDIAERKFASELKEVNDLITTAQAYGDSQLINKLQKSLSDLKQAQDLERKALQAQQATDKQSAAEAKKQAEASAAAAKTTAQNQATATVNTQANTQTSTQSVANTSDMQVLQLQVGNSTFNAQMKRSLVTELMNEIKRLQSVGG
ncbi:MULTISPECIES: phage tail tape measure protein [unclassified Shewanella]|uniref:phage tail tape measure protein n=1 Tax=unclassified Shewanella TaxID=196818 RepID=UPI0021D9ADA1|nr:MULTISPECIES: phage tail tape measure protein [unclassified Shewanella]MCU8034368.1 phage tail tape measure protein [Shewanella sp. SM71]MCU8096075.1 phage tail tape measure protein [Shewanella sp. SM102]